MKHIHATLNVAKFQATRVLQEELGVRQTGTHFCVHVCGSNMNNESV